MKICNIIVDGKTHLALVTERGIVDAAAAGCTLTMDQCIAGADLSSLEALAKDDSLALVENPVYGNVVDTIGKLVCVGFNYRDHAAKTGAKIPDYPNLFSKFANALVPAETPVELPEWEYTYDYEAELVIVVGKQAWNVSEEDAKDYIFGYTCGNDFSLRDAQFRTGQWLIGKTMPGFGPCGPCIVTADSFDPKKRNSIRSYVNSELRQDGGTDDMVFDPFQIVSYASKYIKLEPGDLIFTGTPSGVALEDEGGKIWLKKGDKVDIVIEGIGTLTNTLC